MSQKSELVPKRRFKEFENAGDWEQRELGEIFNYEQPTKYIVKSTEYDDNFNTPVLTAGKSFLLGYTDEISGIKNATVENPVVIFDDFTTGSHYVDFPFKIKSSAMKLLSLNNNSDNFYFMFNTLKNIKYVPQSHERHWISKFSSFEIYKPSQEEQQKIGAFFKKIDDTIALHQRKLDKLNNLKQSYLYQMFPQKGEKVPKLRFDGFSREWEERKLGDLLKYEQPTKYIVESTEYQDDYQTPVLTAGQSFILGYTDEKEGIKNANTASPVIIFDDFTTGSHYVDFDFKVKSSAMKLLERKNENDNYSFLFYSLKNIKYVVQSHERHWISKFSKFKVPYTSYEEQQKIGQFFKKLDETIEFQQKELRKLEYLKEAYLNEMFV